MNTLGNKLRLTTFGESHGIAIGGVVDGIPAGISLDFDAIQYELNRRKPGQSKIVSSRKEPDTVKFLSGIFEGKTTGMPVGFIIENQNKLSKDYDHLKDVFRPSHADFTYYQKYGHRDYRGGGRSSARETANWVVAGAIAKQILKDIEIKAFTSSVGDIFIDKPYQALDFEKIESNDVRCPDEKTAEHMVNLIQQVKKEGDTVGGTITCIVRRVPKGLGEPVFNKLQAALAQAMLSIRNK